MYKLFSIIFLFKWLQNLLKPITPLADSVILFLLRPKLSHYTNEKKRHLVDFILIFLKIILLKEFQILRPTKTTQECWQHLCRILIL